MVKMVAMTVWIGRVCRLQGGEKVKDQDVDEAHGKYEKVYSKGGMHYHLQLGQMNVIRIEVHCAT